jgi:hypothetical protein
MSYQQPPPPPPPPVYPPTPVGYGAPAPRPKKNRTWCIVGCILAFVLGGIGLCCLLPAGLGFWAVKTSGAPAASWLEYVRQGQMDQAGQITVGGTDKARELARRVEDQVGALEPPGPVPLSTNAEFNNGVGRVRIPVSGSKGRATGVFEMEKHGDTWKVTDITFEPATAGLDETP